MTKHCVEWPGAPSALRVATLKPRLRTEAYGGVPVSWTTHLYRPEELAAMLVDAGLAVVDELRLPVHAPSMRPQVLLAARRPT